MRDIVCRGNIVLAGRALLAAAIILAPGAPSGFRGTATADAPGTYAVKGARILVAPGRTVPSGTVVIRNGLIEAAGEGVEAPGDAVVIEGDGLTIHAGFIDACSRIAVPAEKEEGRSGDSKEPDRGASHPLPRIRPEISMMESLAPSKEEMATHRSMGFTAALVVPESGIFRGTSVLIATGDGPARKLVIRQDVAQHIAFEHGRFRQPYPTSLMGSIAAIRQGLADARRMRVWQARYMENPAGMRRPEATSAWKPLWGVTLGEVPVIFEVDSPQNLLRAISLAEEQLLRAIYVGSGFDYEVAGTLAESGAAVIIPLAFSEKPDIDEEGEALEVETRELERYLGARSNPARLAEAGVTIAFGTCRMEKTADFTSNLRTAMDEGLAPQAALAALTTSPARLLGVERSLGTVEAGKAAHLVLRKGDFHEKDSAVQAVWVDGIRYEVKPGKAGAGGAKGGKPGRWPRETEGGAR